MKTPALAAFLLLAATAPDATSLESLRDSWANEAQRLDRDQAEYVQAVAEQDKTIAALQAARQAVNDAIANPQVKVAELRRLEDALTDARDAATHAAEDAAALRRRIYDSIEQMELLGAEMELPEGDLVSSADVDGMWRAEWDSSGDFGVVKLETKGNLVTGTYRITDGRSGTLSGTVTDREMRVETINAQTGARAQVNLTFDSGRRSASGTLLRQDLASAVAAAGNLELRKMDDSEAPDALQEVR